jgi:hypothetical protein
MVAGNYSELKLIERLVTVDFKELTEKLNPFETTPARNGGGYD